MTKYEKYKLILILFLGSLFLYTLYNFSLNNRFVYIEDSPVILDTRTGTIYSFKDRKYIKIDNFTNSVNKNVKK